MAAIDHWHPVYLSKALRREPVSVRLLGKNLVLFRTQTGTVGCLEDYCPHRRMKLSLGCVAGDSLRCKYHGWTFDCLGQGESPGTPKLHAQANHFEAVERHGAIWVKPPECQAAFPQFDIDGWYNICNLSHLTKAPMELVLDNFCEIEHTPTTHALFGYPLERMQEVQCEFFPTDTTVRVVNRGPMKQLGFFKRLIMGIGKEYIFLDDWTTHFSPVYSVYDHLWADPDSGQTSRVRWRLYIFFVPRDDQETSLFTFAFTKTRYWGPAGGARLFRGFMRRNLDYEIQLDVKILEGLADTSTSIEGMKLSRFDKVLGLNRDRIDRIYHGNAAQGSKAEVIRFPRPLPVSLRHG